MQSLDDNDCLERYRQGDANALSELVEHYRRPLFSFILRMTERGDDADEIFQEVWFRAIRNLPDYHNRQFSSWLFRITHNLIIDRGRRRKNEVSIDEDDGAQQIAGKDRSPAETLQDRDMHKRIRKAVDDLPGEQREVFMMRMDAGLPFKEIASIQQTSINTALARMTYALDKLKSALADDYAMINQR